MIIRPGMFVSDRYEIIDKVGSGGMADVYKAKDHRLNRFVAVKVLKAEFSDDTKFVEKFRAEAQAAAGLSHPNVVNVYDVGDENGMYYIVMELVEGITLKSFIERKGRLDVREAVGIAIQIAQGMEAAHSNHIVHRDIKPQNIIISREGKVKVTDFGIAKAVTSDTVTSNAMGSVHYLSPEQARGGFSDEKSDIYSLGVTMYEMLTGRVPFIGDNTVSVALCHLQEDPIPLRSLEPSIPVSLDRIVQKCMQKKPEHRYLSASALISDLKKSLTNPDGAYVQLFSQEAIADAPTISFTPQEMEQIKSATEQAPPVTPAYQQQQAYQQPQAAMESEKTMMRREPVEVEEDEEDEEDVNPKLERLMKAGGVLAAVLIVIIIIFIIVKASGLFGGSKQTPEATATATPKITVAPTIEAEGENEVPDVTNLKFEDVESQLEELGLHVSATRQASDSVEEGYIIEQDLEEGTTIEEDMTIHLVVSSGSEGVAVPSVVGQSESTAKSTLSSSGFGASVEYVFSDDVAKGNVVRTSPSAGSREQKGDVVILYVSKGPEDTDVEVPDVKGMSLSNAKKAMKNAGLELDTANVSYENSSTTEKDKIISQSYSSGSKVEKGTKITVVISLGPEEVKTYKYYASCVISDNPFTSEDQTGIVKLILKQDGKSKTIYEESHGMGDFPLSIPEFEGYSDSDGEIYMYLDREFVGGPYTISFTAREED